ncbi:MAG: RNA 2',3'-cyclic phosphodiesterase [Candidatus Micrarchaeota archaeon]|nr:RNA 2',3'-cyclic phosphodiesterase [Candidatus Micrarchaeota archaeon]
MRLFVAIKVPPGLHPQIAQAAGHLRDCMGVKVLPPENWHLTLRFIGDVDEPTAKRIGDALAQVRFAPFKVRLSGAGAYPSAHFPRAIFIAGESEGAVALAAKVEDALAPFGLQKEKFSVHVTVARSKGAGDIDAFLKNTGEVGEFGVRSFVLMDSRLLPGGAAYEVLKECPAQENQA